MYNLQHQPLRHKLGIAFLAFASLITNADITCAGDSASSASDEFQRAVFSLNMNPVAWEYARKDMDAISMRVREFDGRLADALTARIDFIVAEFAKPPVEPPDDDLGPGAVEAAEQDPLPRLEAARQAFELLTRAMSSLARHRLEQIARAEPNARESAVASAKEAFDAFRNYLAAYDPNGLARLDAHWTQLTAAKEEKSKTDPGATEIDEITRYLRDNFGPAYRATGDRPFVPIPLASPTVDRHAVFHFPLPPGSRIDRPIPRPRQILNSVERGASERELPLSSLGAAAFNNPTIFGKPARTFGITCNSCHEKSGNNADFFIPGLSARPGGIDVSNGFFAPHGNNAVFDALDIPDLRGIRFTAPYGRNGRFASLREFTRNVIVNEFNGDEPEPILLDAMVIYMNEFDFVRNPSLNANGSLNPRASEAARRGEKIFKRPFVQFNDRSCASCHIPDSHFLDHQRHDIGTVAGYADFSRDRALDTPTLLGTASSAPYFHDGSMPTLRSVVEWFDERFKLQLSKEEIDDLTSYVATVGNGIHVFSPGDNFLEEDLEDMEAFITAADFLFEKEKWNVLADHYRGLAIELKRQIGIAKNPTVKPVLEEMARYMNRAADAAQKRDGQECKRQVREWRNTYRKNRYELR